MHRRLAQSQHGKLLCLQTSAPHLEAAPIDVAPGLQRVGQHNVLRGLRERVRDVGRLRLLRALPPGVLRGASQNRHP